VLGGQVHPQRTTAPDLRRLERAHEQLDPAAERDRELVNAGDLRVVEQQRLVGAVATVPGETIRRLRASRRVVILPSRSQRRSVSTLTPIALAASPIVMSPEATLA